MFFRTDHMLGHKISLKNFKKTDVISSIFSDHNGIKQEIKYMMKTRKITNMRINNMY